MSLFSSIGKAISGAVSSVGKAVESAVSTVGHTVTDWVSTPATTRPSTGNTNTQFVAPTDNLGILWCIADALHKPPASITKNFSDRVSFAASYLKVPVVLDTTTRPVPTTTVSSNSGLLGSFTTWIGAVVTTTRAVSTSAVRPSVTGRTNPWYSVPAPRVWTADELSQHTAATAEANVLALTDRVKSFADRAKNAGFEPPDNPFLILAQVNQKRGTALTTISPYVSSQLAADLIFNIKAYIDLLDAENQGAINLKTGEINTSQLSHIKLSFSGFGGSGNTATDLLSFLPNADQIKSENARQALSVLDFGKRIPYLLYTLDYTPSTDGSSQGTIVGWKKIPDASGYIIKRRSVFSGDTKQWEVDNAGIQSQSDSLMSYARTFALSFLDDIDEKSVMMYCDQETSADELYIYNVQAYQVRNDQKGATFTVDTKPVSITPTIQNQITETIKDQSNWPDYTITGWSSAGTPIKSYNNFTETISPWPAVAQVLYGDSTYDWILAASNVRASINRLDDRATTRLYSYLNAHSSFLFQQAAKGKLVMPSDVNQVVQKINDSIQKYGVSQTIQNLLDETGISYYYEGRDPKDDTHFDRAGTDTVLTSNLFNIVASAIDPETATLDLKSLASNMSQLLSQNLLSVSTKVAAGSTAKVSASPSEVAVPFPDETSAAQAEGSLQFIDKLGDLRDGVIDLTTFDGLSKLMRTIRILSDFGPDRLPATKPPTDVAKPPPPAPPAPPKPTTTQQTSTTTATGWWDFANAGSSGSPTWRTGTPPPGAKTSR